MWQCLDVLLVATTGQGGRGATGIWWVEARDAANHPAMPRTAPPEQKHVWPHPKDVAVIGLPHARLGEIAAAIVEIKEDMTCTEEEINAFCMGLPRYKRPRKVIFDKIPRNPTGKIEKPVLREKYCSGRLVEAQITG